MSDCAKWQCDNDRKDGYAYCEQHPPLVDHGLEPNEVDCPECGEQGAGTIHDDLWYCLTDYGYDGCGEAIFDPYKLAGIEKEPKWNPPE
jgi:hypothetical protein